MHRLEGSVRISGKIAYVPQVACIYNMTVRDNILFGQKFDPDRYDSVLQACELLNDIYTFPAGDLTEVGEKGETLSGGQKQRISLARAVYSGRDIYLLDDPFSALDPKVAAKVFEKVLGHNGLLKKKTRVLVSNQGNLLKHMNILILMDKNTLTVYQSLEELLQDERAPKTLSIGTSGLVKRGPADSQTQKSLLEKNESNGRLTKLESQTSSKHLIIRASNSARFVEGAFMSRVLQHATETVDSLSSVRSYEMVERFCSHFCRLAEWGMLPYNAWMCCFRVSRALVSAVGFAIVLATFILAVVNTTNEASSVGLALSSSLSIPLIMTTLCFVLFACLQQIVAFERALEYTELPQEVGVVGRTGAGKSSLVLAVLRVLKSSRGSILIDGVDINAVPLRRLRNALTVIPQDPSLVRGSLRDNLDATGSHKDEELWQALREAHLADFVASQRNNLLLEVGDGGSNLSVGQRQLVCLARALLRKPKVLLLDEATSQMDGDTDRLIQTTLKKSFARCTILAIAHRINTVLDYDKILVMGDGRVLEYGPVDQLLTDEKSLFNEMAKKAGVLAKRGSFTGDSSFTKL
ncbi:hypothetical protein IscW_ISCW020353 [Ixodes scapularis]|uniref:ABC transporter domain-containing protein n=1 Tax=Ixodes scapularis TaxID=6945 RepID=B7PY15_IXOSC|nr:hypothetical protein IscW_ISCW020353 [Ixodes scapularis]|eukprot:XP_002402303.1 hypothetical protein IscW_ISCW020353 [Ixodes scapularis]